MKFYNRAEEIKTMKKIRKDFRIAVLGRRRIGKTRLVEHTYKEKCITLFIPAEKAEKEIIAGWVEEYPELHLPRVESFKEFFEHIFTHHTDRVIFMDELQNILKVNKSFFYDLQRLIDKHKPKLIVSGSLLSTMKKIVETYRQPLYGRFDFILKLKELSFPSVYLIGKDLNLTLEDTFKVYAVFGGIPKYYELIEKMDHFEFKSLIAEMFVNYPRPLYEEVRTMLREEFGTEHRTFFSILSAISQGNNRLSEIAGFIGREPTEITKYLSLLQKDFEIIERKTPVISGKKGVYAIKNNLFQFWFNHIWRYNQLLETGEDEAMEQRVLNRLDTHVAFQFEKTIRELIHDHVIPMPFPFAKIGTQWGKIPDAPKGKNQYEIDICALNKERSKILFGECKWQERVDAQKVLNDLKKKSQYAISSDDQKEIYFALFAKSFKNSVQNKNVLLIDLKKIEKYLKKPVVKI